jgi:hypothetical protein
VSPTHLQIPSSILCMLATTPPSPWRFSRSQSHHTCIWFSERGLSDRQKHSSSPRTALLNLECFELKDTVLQNSPVLICMWKVKKVISTDTIRVVLYLSELSRQVLRPSYRRIMRFPHPCGKCLPRFFFPVFWVKLGVCFWLKGPWLLGGIVIRVGTEI